MTISAKVIADSVTTSGERLTTFQLKYPRFIHAEFMTHRTFSRNASSSRAIPVKRQIEAILEDPAMPVHWGKNQRGMQADGEHSADVVIKPEYHPQGEYAGSTETGLICDGPVSAWHEALENAVAVARAFDEAGYHKQVVNRILEPFAHINVVVTASYYGNFFALRRHADAQPEIKVLADVMWEALSASDPAKLEPRDWHLPYVSDEDIYGILQRNAIPTAGIPIDPWTMMMIKVSVARCARVSYMTHDGARPTVDADMALYDRLVGSVPLHASPAEHQARVQEVPDPLMCGNLSPAWMQYRKTLPHENAE